MARIFFHTDTGNIYGVHPGPHENDAKITLPENVAWITVAGVPSEISWPPLSDGSAGDEQSSRIDLPGRNIVLRDDIEAPLSPREQITAKLKSDLGFRSLALALKADRSFTREQLLDYLEANYQDEF